MLRKIIYRFYTFYKRPIFSNLSLLYFTHESLENIGLFIFVTISYLGNFLQDSIKVCLSSSDNMN